jgi:hypothetical protein
MGDCLHSFLNSTLDRELSFTPRPPYCWRGSPPGCCVSPKEENVAQAWNSTTNPSSLCLLSYRGCAPFVETREEPLADAHHTFVQVTSDGIAVLELSCNGAAFEGCREAFHRAVWVLQCGYCSVGIAVWVLKWGYCSVGTAVWVLRCGYCSVVTAVWILQCGYCSVGIAVGVLQCGYCSVGTAV